MENKYNKYIEKLAMNRIFETKINRRELLKLTALAAAYTSLNTSTGCATLPESKAPDIDYSRGLLLTNCNVLDVVKGEVLKNRAILVRDGKIVAITGMDEAPTGEIETININNRFIGPGFIDAHCHITTPGAADFEFSKTSSIVSQFKRNHVQHIMSGIAMGLGTKGRKSVMLAMHF